MALKRTPEIHCDSNRVTGGEGIGGGAVGELDHFVAKGDYTEDRMLRGVAGFFGPMFVGGIGNHIPEYIN
jgi:hypothetical protein